MKVEKKFMTLRASLLPTFLDCARRAALRIEELRGKTRKYGVDIVGGGTGIGAVVGTALHYYAEGIGGETAAQWLDKAIEKNGGSVLWDEKTPNHFEACRQLGKMAERFDQKFRGEEWREGAILEKELAQEFPVHFDGKKIYARLSGHPDKIGGDGSVHDLKTGRIKEFAHGAQLGGYARMVEMAGYAGATAEVPYCEIHFVPRPNMGGKVAKAQSEKYRRDDCVNQARLALQAAGRAVIDFEEGGPNAISANPGSTLCSRLYCPAYGTDWCKMTKEFD